MKSWKTWGLVAALLAASSASQAATVELTGEDEAYRASVETTVMSSHGLAIEVHNTSDTSDPDWKKAPTLRRLGFNLSDVAPMSCWDLEGPSGWKLKAGGAFCLFGCGWEHDWDDTNEGDEFDALFDLQIRAKGWGNKGLKAGESASFVLTVDPACGVELSESTFADAPQSIAGSDVGQWAARFRAVKWVEKKNKWWGWGWGWKKKKSKFPKVQWSCAAGDLEDAEPPVEPCAPEFSWGELVVGAADLNELPSDFMDPDSRAGSLQMFFNGGVGFDADGASTDAAHQSATVSLRNGAGSVLERWEVNRRFPGGQGCVESGAFPVCWVSAAMDAVDGLLSVFVPTFAPDSNDGFDDSGERVRIEGELLMDYTSGATTFEDNGHQTLRVTWVAPLGLDSAQLLLRGRYDAASDGLGSEDVLEVLFSRNVGGIDDSQLSGVVVLEESETTLTIAINVQAGLSDLCSLAQ